jgi:ABC-type multidrug transport system permease subunit
MVKVCSAIIQALVCGSLFYNLAEDSSSIFLRPGVLFFPVLYFLLESLSETVGSYMGRPILSRQKRFGFYRPTAFAIANAITDIPVVIIQVTCFSLILYFMAALQMDAGRFFTFWIIVIMQTLAFIQLFRSVGAVCKTFGNASKISGLLSTVFFVYGGKNTTDQHDGQETYNQQVTSFHSKRCTSGSDGSSISIPVHMRLKL